MVPFTATPVSDCRLPEDDDGIECSLFAVQVTVVERTWPTAVHSYRDTKRK